MTDFPIYTLKAGAGRIGISPLPGRRGDLAADIAKLQALDAAMVVSMTTLPEMERVGSGGLGAKLTEAGIGHAHFPVGDFGIPRAEDAARWQSISETVQAHLARGETVVFHCYGGRGRSGMGALRTMVALGENPQDAFVRLRQHHPEAVETDAQRAWASDV